MTWELPRRIGFRFLFSYLTLYTTGLFGLTNVIVPWVSTRLLGWTAPPPIQTSGSGDTLFHWVQALAVLGLAVAATLVWSVLDRRRTHYHTLSACLRAWLRYGLGVALIGYGMAKVIQTQFPPLGSYNLSRTLGEASPMGLLWNFMSYSAGYNLFTGLAEAVPGVLLIFRRTALVGALVAVAVMTNVVALNFFYDVPVKIFSTHLLLIALVIASPDLPRLARLLVIDNQIPPAINRPRLVFGWQFVKAALLVLAIGYGARTGIERQAEIARAMAGDRIFGTYEVEEFRHGKSPRWVEAKFGPSELRATASNGDQSRYQCRAGERSLTIISSSGDRFDLALRWPKPGTLELSGSLAGEPLQATLRKRTSGFPLLERGFHWVSEAPFNR